VKSISKLKKIFKTPKNGHGKANAELQKNTERAVVLRGYSVVGVFLAASNCPR
jgi:hypothetical protein